MNWLWRIVSAVIVGLVVAWSVGLMNQVVPAPARARLLLENLFSDNHPRPDDGFRIVLCWMENDDSGFDTRLVELAFSGVGGIELVRSARIVAAQGASDEWREGMRAGVREALDEWNADLAIAGFVRKSRGVTESVVCAAIGRWHARSRGPVVPAGRSKARWGFSR